MNILIKGMEMPKEGNWITLRVFPDGQCFLYSWCGNDFDFMEHLTAVPVPPHGRLIDGDAFVKYVKECFEAVKSEFKTLEYKDFARDLAESICLDVEDAPTIIPAEEGE